MARYDVAESTEAGFVDSEVLRTVDFTKLDEPAADSEMRTLLTGWLAYQRRTFIRKLRDLDPAGIVDMAIPPLEISILGLVRHMTQMEHVYLSWGLGGGERILAYGDDDFAGGSAGTFDEDLSRYTEEVARADHAIAALPSLESQGLGHSWPLGATLIKMVQEYAVHNGQGHMLRHAVMGEIVR